MKSGALTLDEFSRLERAAAGNDRWNVAYHAEMLAVFCSAYLCRDAAVARGWWEHMQARKPTQFNVDYWRACSALHWVEGNLKVANESWKKSNGLAQQLPRAGAYEFDRYCCTLLRQALDESAVARTASST